VVQVGVSGGRRDTVDVRDKLNSVSSLLTVVLRTSTGKVAFVPLMIIVSVGYSYYYCVYWISS